MKDFNGERKSPGDPHSPHTDKIITEKLANTIFGKTKAKLRATIIDKSVCLHKQRQLKPWSTRDF